MCACEGGAREKGVDVGRVGVVDVRGRIFEFDFEKGECGVFGG